MNIFILTENLAGLACTATWARGREHRPGSWGTGARQPQASEEKQAEKAILQSKESAVPAEPKLLCHAESGNKHWVQIFAMAVLGLLLNAHLAASESRHRSKADACLT